MKISRFNRIWCVAKLTFLIVCLSPLSIESRSISDGRPNERDPMLALPSDANQQPREVSYVAHYQQAQPIVEYHQQQQQQQQPPPQQSQHQASQEVVIEYQAQPQAEQHQHQPMQQQQIIYTRAQPQHEQQQQQQPQQQYQLVQVPAPVDQTQRDEQGAGQNEQQQAAGGEYPGEIVYIGQNGEISELQHAQQAQQQGGDSLAKVANSLAHNNGLSATILTEVPVRDMPAEVLNKLRREYGVKVVATRERPGANLVINCDEHPTAGQGSSICNKQQQPAAYEYHQGYPSEHQPDHQGHQHQRSSVYQVESEYAAHNSDNNNNNNNNNNESHNGASAAHAPIEAYQGVVDELLHNEPYHHLHANAPTGDGHEQANDAGQANHAADQRPNLEAEYYSSRTTVAAATVGEQPPTESSYGYQGRSIDQTNGDNSSGSIGHEQPSHEHSSLEHANQEAPAQEVGEQSAGFDEQPKSDNTSEYRQN